eukprot:Tbor_TRINITY_DN6029_c1_g1::TRINITY_DN6029_c1_g1_i11::g.10289::m.10289
MPFNIVFPNIFVHYLSYFVSTAHLFIVNGWGIQSLIPPTGNKKEGKDEKGNAGGRGSKRQFYAQVVGARGSEKPRDESILSNIQLDRILHKVLVGTKVHWMAASCIQDIETRSLLKRIEKGFKVITLCVRNRWILGRMSAHGKDVNLEIYDSAPSAQIKSKKLRS